MKLIFCYSYEGSCISSVSVLQKVTLSRSCKKCGSADIIIEDCHCDLSVPIPNGHTIETIKNEIKFSPVPSLNDAMHTAVWSVITVLNERFQTRNSLALFQLEASVVPL